MVVDFDNKQLADTLGTTIKSTTDAKQDFFESEQSPDQQLVGIDNVIVEFSTLKIRSNTLSPSVFQLDHPIYSRVDISTLKLTGTYLSTSDTFIINNNDIFKEQLSNTTFINTGLTTASIDTTARTCTFGVSSSTLVSSTIAKDSNKLFSAFTITANFTGSIQALVSGNFEAGSPTYTTVTLVSGIPVSGTFSVLGSTIGYKLLSTTGVLQSQLLIKYS